MSDISTLTDEQREKKREYMREYYKRRKENKEHLKNCVTDCEVERHPIYFAKDSTPKQRVEEELSNIQSLYIKLCAFTSGDKFKTLCKAQQRLLIAQRQIQSSYIENT